LGILAPALPVSTIRTFAGSGVNCLRVNSRLPQVLLTLGGLLKSRVLYRLLRTAALAEISSTRPKVRANLSIKIRQFNPHALYLQSFS
jgi:hypothetical protein